MMKLNGLIWGGDMIITICPDSYKGSLTSNEASEIMKKACLKIMPEAKIFAKPMADGGEGTVDTLIKATGGRQIFKKVTNALGKQVSTYYGVDAEGKVAFLEIANIAGIAQLKDEERNPYRTTSYGVGEMLLNILDEGIQKIIIGLGGSATVDGGIGFLQALGVTFYDEAGVELNGFGADLLKVNRIDFSNLDERLKHVEIQVAADVRNPLYGRQGASYVFGPQKGATNEQVQQLDTALERYSSYIEAELGKTFNDIEGAGAAGGLGFALASIGGKLTSGAELIGHFLQIEDAIKKSDLVLTGEGKSDEQTLYGKVPNYISQIAKKYDVPVILISGSVENYERLHEHFTAAFSILNKPMTLKDAIENVEQLLYNQTVNLLQFFKTIRR